MILFGFWNLNVPETNSPTIYEFSPDNNADFEQSVIQAFMYSIILGIYGTGT